MKINLGCGPDVRDGYVNVDKFVTRNDVEHIDLSMFPWPWADESADEILMLDFLEHFPYKMTDTIIHEVWRVLKPDGFVDIQVPDFEHCAHAALMVDHAYMCNVCGNSGKNTTIKDGVKCCAQCGTPIHEIAEAAIKRLYGGQDFEGNFHYTAFTKELLELRLINSGFHKVELLEKHHQFANWNFKVRAYKKKDLW